jgi:hypothetical protein
MASFAVHPTPFLPPGIQVEDGGNQRIPQAVVNLAGNILHAHEEYVLAEDNLQILDNADILTFMHQVSDYIGHTFHIPVCSVCRDPFGIGLYQLDTTFHKDLLMAGNPHNIDVSFINHGHALNRRN